MVEHSSEKETLNDGDSLMNGQSLTIAKQNGSTNGNHHLPLQNGMKNGHTGNGVHNNNKMPSNGTAAGIHDPTEPPDGGARAWIVMISAFLCNGVIFGVINTYSVTHSYLQTKMAQDGDPEASSKAALVGSLTIGMTFLLSPTAGVLTDKIGLRPTAFIGGTLCTGGMLLSSFYPTDITILCLSYGIMFGIGGALVYTPTLAVLGHYFKRYLGKVSGFVTAGSSIFTAILPPFLEHLLENYGINIMLRVLALISSLMIICAFFYKPTHPPPPPPKHKPGRSAINRRMRKLINVEIWKRKRYVVWVIGVPLALCGYFVPYVHMGKFVGSVFPDASSKSLPVMCIGLSSGVGRMIFGYISDLPRVNRMLLQQIALIGIGILTILLPATKIYWLLIVISLILGLFDGCFITLIGPIAVELCGPQGASQAIGFLLGLSSVPLTIGPVITGMIYDSQNSYTLPLILAGIPPLIGANLMFLTRCIKDSDVTKQNGTSLPLKDGADLPLAKSAWNSDKPSEVIVINGTNKEQLQQQQHSPALTSETTAAIVQTTGERKASLASAESLNDVSTLPTIDGKET